MGVSQTGGTLPVSGSPSSSVVLTPATTYKPQALPAAVKMQLIEIPRLTRSHTRPALFCFQT